MPRRERRDRGDLFANKKFHIVASPDLTP